MIVKSLVGTSIDRTRAKRPLGFRARRKAFPKWRIGSDGGHALEGATRAKLWWMALKPPMYSVALVPLCVGSACAKSFCGSFDIYRFWMAWIGCVSTIAWLNLSNDAFDADTGVDEKKPESIVQLVGNKGSVMVLAWTLLLVGIFIFVRIGLDVGDSSIFHRLLLAITLGYVYQGPPFRLSYVGLGEPICFFTFGPLATSAFYSMQFPGSGVPPLVWAASVLVGMTTTTILFCSHFHQIVEDKAVGKLSPIVRLGTEQASKLLRSAVLAYYLFQVAFCCIGWLPWSCALTMLPGLFLARKLAVFVLEKHNKAKEVFVSKYIAVRWHSLQGVLLAAGLLVARLRPV